MKYNTIRLEVVTPDGHLALTPIYVKPEIDADIGWNLGKIQSEAIAWLKAIGGDNTTAQHAKEIVLNGSLLVGYGVTAEIVAKQMLCTPDTVHECYRNVRFDDPSS